jgi:hypothetical protein
MDIVASSLGVVGDSLVGTITTDGLSDGFSDTGDEFGFEFTVNGVDVTLYADRDLTGETAGLVPTGPATASYDVASKTVTVKAKLSDLDKAVGSATAGKQLSGISSYSSNQLAAQFVLISYDTAETTASALVSPGCGTDSGTPGESASPSPSPSATANPGPATGGDGLFALPRKSCFEFKDPSGDADPTGTGLDNEAALDVTGLVYKSSGGVLQAFVGLADPSAAVEPVPVVPLFDGPVYNLSMTVNGKVVALTASADGPATATVGGAANTDVKATLKLDAASKYGIFSVPVDGLSKAVGATVADGTAITATSVLTQGDSQLGAQDADTATGTTPEEKTYTYGDNSCVQPPAGTLELEADTKAQYSDLADLYAALTDADGAPVAGATIRAALGGAQAVTAVTDADGIAELHVPVLVPAGTKTLTVWFDGTSEVGKTSKAIGFTALVEKTKLKAVSSRGGATATLKDDDGKPVVGRSIHFLVGKTKKSVKTNAKGVAVLKGLKKGTVVKVSFPGVPGLYTGTPTITVKAG